MRIAVTGGVGFIGHEVVERLIDDGHEVTVVDFLNDLIPLYEKHKFPIIEQIYRILPKCQEVISPWKFIEEGAGKYDVVVHAGAIVDTTDMGSTDLFQRNVYFTKLLAEECNKEKTDIIFFSSAATYGVKGYPNNPYGLTKSLGERYMKRCDRIRTASLRLFNVFGKYEHHKGPMASVAWQIAEAFEKGREFRLFNKTAKRDFVPSSTVADVVSKMVRKLDSDTFKWNLEFDVGTGIPISFEGLVDEIAAAKKHSGPSPVVDVEMPQHLVGRYQFFTCAGKNGVENLGGSMGTPEGIRRAYGMDR